MKPTCWLFFCCMLAASTNAHADQVIGNGGDVLVCYDNADNVTSLELVDFYEARTIRGLYPRLGDPSLSAVDKAKAAIQAAFGFYDPARAARYMALADSFVADASFVDFTLPDIPDTGELWKPDNCQIEQMAIHLIPRTPNDKTYVIQAKYWDSSLFNNDQKAGLILHEIIYGEAFLRGHRDSRLARYLNSLVAAHWFAAADAAQYWRTMLFAGMLGYRAYSNDWVFELFDAEPRNFSDALNFCQSLSTSSTLTQKTRLASAWPDIHDSSIARRLVATIGDPAYVWIRGNTDFQPVKAEVGTRLQFHDEDQDVQLASICQSRLESRIWSNNFSSQDLAVH